MVSLKPTLNLLSSLLQVWQTCTIITQLKSQQDAMEVQTNNRFNTLHTEIQALLKAFNLKPSSSLPQPASTRNGSQPYSIMDDETVPNFSFIKVICTPYSKAA